MNASSFNRIRELLLSLPNRGVEVRWDRERAERSRDCRRSWPHFFVESIDELQAWHRKVATGGSSEIVLAFEATSGPEQIAFPRHRLADRLARLPRMDDVPLDILAESEERVARGQISRRPVRDAA